MNFVLFFKIGLNLLFSASLLLLEYYFALSVCFYQYGEQYLGQNFKTGPHTSLYLEIAIAHCTWIRVVYNLHKNSNHSRTRERLCFSQVEKKL